MFTYILIGLPFIAAVILTDVFILKTRVVLTKECWIVMGILMFMTILFDQLLTGLPIVNYNEGHMTGLRLWHMPVEDLMYTFAAVIGLGSLREHYGKR